MSLSEIINEPNNTIPTIKQIFSGFGAVFLLIAEGEPSYLNKNPKAPKHITKVTNE